MSSQITPEDHEEQVGRTKEHWIGTITRKTAQRYARAVEDDNPLFHDPVYARRRGFDDVVVPPNYLSAIIDPTSGRPADELRDDGIDPELFPVTLPETAGLMGGGQRLTIDRYVTAGESIWAEETFTGIYQKDSDEMGTLTFLEREMEYFDEDDERVLQCEETMIVGDRE